MEYCWEGLSCTRVRNLLEAGQLPCTLNYSLKTSELAYGTEHSTSAPWGFEHCWSETEENIILRKKDIVLHFCLICASNVKIALQCCSFSLGSEAALQSCSQLASKLPVIQTCSYCSLTMRLPCKVAHVLLENLSLLPQWNCLEWYISTWRENHKLLFTPGSSEKLPYWFAMLPGKNCCSSARPQSLAVCNSRDSFALHCSSYRGSIEPVAGFTSDMRVQMCHALLTWKKLVVQYLSAKDIDAWQA